MAALPFSSSFQGLYGAPTPLFPTNSRPNLFSALQQQNGRPLALQLEEEFPMLDKMMKSAPSSCPAKQLRERASAGAEKCPFLHAVHKLAETKPEAAEKACPFLAAVALPIEDREPSVTLIQTTVPFERSKTGAVSKKRWIPSPGKALEDVRKVLFERAPIVGTCMRCWGSGHWMCGSCAGLGISYGGGLMSGDAVAECNMCEGHGRLPCECCNGRGKRVES